MLGSETGSGSLTDRDHWPGERATKQTLGKEDWFAQLCLEMEDSLSTAETGN